MEQTSRLSIVIDTGNAETTIRRLERSLSDLQRQGTNTANSLANLGRQSSLNGLLSGVARASGGMANLGSSVSRTAGIFSNYYNSLNRTTNNFNQFNNTINRTTNNITRMGDTINRNITVINNYNRGLSGTHDALSKLQGILTGGMFGVFALSVAKTADSMQETHSQIKLVTKSHEEYLVVADRLHEMAGKNLKDFQATAGLYTNSARALGQLGKSQEEVLKFTNAVSLAMSVGGKSAQEQASALLQLGQAMQSGALQGDEFRSVAENAPILLDLIAEKLGKTRAEIKELGSDGKITSMVIHDALADATPKLQEMFDKMPVTMSQGFSVLKNEYKKFTHEFMNGEGGISSVVAKGLVDVSRNFENFATILMGTAATWGILKVAQSSFVTTTIPALIAGTTGSISTFYAQGVAMLTTATSTSALSRALTMATLRGASFAVSVAVGTREILRKAVAVGTATRTFLAHSASVLRSSMSVAGLRANIGLLTRSVLTNTGAFWRGTVAVQAKTLAMGALGVASRATAGTVGVLAGSIKSLGAIINAHPIMFLSTVIFGVVASTEGLQGAMDSLSDTVKVVGSIFGEFITTTGHGLKNGIGSAIDWVADLLGKKSKDGTSVANKAFNELFGNTEKGFLGILQVIARVFDIAAAGFWGFVDYGSQQFDNMVIKAKNAWSSLQSFFGFGDGYQIPTIEVSFSDAFKKALANQKANGMESLLLSHNGRVQANKSLDLSAVDLTVPSQAQTSSSPDKDKDKKGKKDNKKSPEGYLLKDEQKAWNRAYKNSIDYNFAKYEKQYGVPEGLLLAIHMKESGGNANALGPMTQYGRAKGGFQFIDATARAYGLKGRDVFDLGKSAEAAARYLSYLLKMFGGDVDKAIAAYNTGEGNVQKHPWELIMSNRWARMKNGKGQTFEYVKGVNRYRAYANGGNNPKSNPNDIAKSINQSQEQLQKQRDDIIQSFQTKAQQNQKEREQLYANIQTLFAHDPTVMENMLNRAKASHKYQDLADGTRFLLDSQGHQMDKVAHLQNEHLLGVYQLFARTDIDWSDKYSLKSGLDGDFFTKYHGLMLEQKQRNLDNSEGVISPLQRLKLEKDIAIYRKRYIDHASNEEIKATEVLYDRKISIEQTQEELTKKRLVFEAKQYDMTAEDRILANANIASLELATQTELSDEIRQLHQDAITAKYQHEMAEHQKARNKILTDAKNDYERLKHVYLNSGDKYAGLRYDLQKDENNYSTVEIDTIIEQQKKNQTFQSFVDLQNRLKETRFNPLEHGDYFSALSGTAGLMQTTWQNYDTTKEQHQNELEQLKARLDEKQITEEEYRQEREQLEKRHQDSMLQLSLASGGGVLNGLTQMAKHAIGEQSNTYRTMYQLTKAFYLAEAGLAVYKAGSDAWANEKGTTWQKVAAAAKAVALSSDFVRLISSANPKGFKTGGYTGNLGTSQIAGVVHGQEYVVNAKATKRIGVDNLNKLNSGGSLGGNVNNISVNVTVNADGSSNVQASHQLGKEMGQAIVAVVQNELRKEMKQGGMLDRHYRRIYK